MAQFANDTFTEASNTTLASHTADDGGTWTAHFSGATAQVLASEDKVQGTNSGATSSYYHSGSPATAEYDVEATISSTSVGTATAYPGLLGRLDTATNTKYEVYYEGNNNRIVFQKVINGTGTSLGTSAFTPDANVGYQLKLEIRDATKKVYLGGVEIISSTDNAITAAGKAGIRVRQNGRIDNFTATDAGSASTYSLTGAAGSFTETGVAATLKAARKLSASAASFALTGQDVTLTGPGAKTLTAAAGSFTLTGQDIALEVAVEAAIASFTLSGQTAGLRAGRKLTASADSFALTGQAAMLARTRALAATAGSFSLLGNVVALTFSGAAALTGPGDATLANSGASVTLSNRP